MRNVAPIVALAGVFLIMATSGCPESGGTSGTQARKTQAPGANNASATPPASASTAASPDASASTCPTGVCAGIENENSTGSSDPGSASATIAPFQWTAQSTVSQINFWKGDKNGVPMAKDGTETLTVLGATACVQFTAEALYEGGDKAYPVNWSSGNTNLITIDASGKACLALTPTGSIAAGIPVTATATGVANAASSFKLNIKLEIPASADVTVK